MLSRVLFPFRLIGHFTFVHCFHLLLNAMDFYYIKNITIVKPYFFHIFIHIVDKYVYKLVKLCRFA